MVARTLLLDGLRVEGVLLLLLLGLRLHRAVLLDGVVVVRQVAGHGAARRRRVGQEGVEVELRGELQRRQLGGGGGGGGVGVVGAAVLLQDDVAVEVQRLRWRGRVVVLVVDGVQGLVVRGRRHAAAGRHAAAVVHVVEVEC